MGHRGYACGVVSNAAAESVTERPGGRLDARSDDLVIESQAVDGAEGCMTLRLSGRLGADDLDRFRDRAGAALEAGFVRLILNCAGLRELTGAATGAFAALQRTLRLRGGDVALVALPEPAGGPFRTVRPFQTGGPFQLLGFADLFTVAATTDEAVSRLTAADRPAPAVIFPRVVECPACAARLRTVKSGRFRCSQCQAVLAINNGAQVFAA